MTCWIGQCPPRCLVLNLILHWVLNLSETSPPHERVGGAYVEQGLHSSQKSDTLFLRSFRLQSDSRSNSSMHIPNSCSNSSGARCLWGDKRLVHICCLQTNAALMLNHEKLISCNLSRFHFSNVSNKCYIVVLHWLQRFQGWLKIGTIT